jgi:subtilisin family serine protease
MNTRENSYSLPYLIVRNLEYSRARMGAHVGLTGEGEMKIFLATAILLATSFIAPVADAYWLPPVLSPVSPQSGQLVSVVMAGGGCDFMISEVGYPQITRNGNDIRIVIRTVHQAFGEFCTIPPFSYPWPLGTFEPGNYNVQVDIYFYQDALGEHAETLAILPMTVAAAPVPAPVNSLAGLITLAILIAFVAYRKFSFNLLAIILLSHAAIGRAQETDTIDIEVLLANAPGAPTAEVVVDYARNPIGEPPLISLRNLTPRMVAFALNSRAQGDAAEFLREHPDTPRARLERSIVLVIPNTADIDVVLELLQRDPYVAAANVRVPTKPSSAELTGFEVTSSLAEGHVEDLGTHRAWNISPGYALVIAVDMGIAKRHPAFSQFLPPSPTYLGGNLAEVASYDVGMNGTPPPSGFDSRDVDEAKPVNNPAPPCPIGMYPPENAGHGTHVAGLIAANSTTGSQRMLGACKHCGLGMIKWSRSFCLVGPNVMHLSSAPGKDVEGVYMAAAKGAQVMNLSFGGTDTYGGGGFCHYIPSSQLCIAVAEATARDIIVVAASGNDRARLDYPASNDDVVSAGGLVDNISLALWNESPGSTANCPTPPPGYIPPSGHDYECGSNSTLVPLGQRQELVAAAKSVRSTTYPGYNWTADLKCGDGFPGPLGTGIGQCTGTSMSAPQIAGIMGIVRSINPLVLTGIPEPPSGIRGVLATTTFEKVANPSYAWSQQFGYGRPNPEAAAKKMLGSVRDTAPRNRVTPLFRLYSAGNTDFADTTSPQFALSLRLDQKESWKPHTSAMPVPNYEFPYNGIKLDSPTAAIYVLTTPFRPRPTWAHLKPLYLMSHPAGSDGYADVDYMLATSKAEIEAAHALHYDLWNIQGYIFENCTSNCPPGAEVSPRFHRRRTCGINEIGCGRT